MKAKCMLTLAAIAAVLLIAAAPASSDAAGLKIENAYYWDDGDEYGYVVSVDFNQDVHDYVMVGTVYDKNNNVIGGPKTFALRDPTSRVAFIDMAAPITGNGAYVVFSVDGTGVLRANVNCQVTYMDGNSSLKTEYLSIGDSVSYQPTKTGMDFDGWYKDAELTDGWTGKVSKSMTLYAKWTDSVEKFDIAVNKSGNGTASADKERAEAGETVTLTAIPNYGYIFKKWISEQVTVGSDNTFSMPSEDVTVTAEFVLEGSHDITVRSDGNGTASADKGSAMDGETVTLTPAPDEGYILDRWVSVPSVTIGDDNKFTMPNKDVTVTANFVKVYGVSITQSANGTVSADKTQAKAGATVTLTATPDAGYAFKEWHSTVTIGGDNKFTMPASDVNINAVFVKSYDVAVCAQEKGTGQPAAQPDKAYRGQSVQLTPNPAPGYYLSRWESVPSVTIGNDNKFIMPDADVSITAVYAKYTEVSKETESGSVTIPAAVCESLGIKDPSKLTLALSRNNTPSQHNIPKDAFAYDIVLKYEGKTLSSFSQNIEVKIKFTVPEGHTVADYSLYYVSQDGTSVEKIPNVQYKGGSYVFPISHLSTFAVSPQAIKPLDPTKYSIAVGTETTGTGVAKTDKTLASQGETVTLSVVSVKDGYVFKEWKSSQVTVGNDNTFEMPAMNVTVKAVFAQQYTVTLTQDGRGTVSASPDKVFEKDTVQLTATPATGYTFKEWKSSQVTVGKDNKFVMPAMNVTVKAVFEVAVDPDVTLSCDNGTLTIPGPEAKRLGITDTTKLDLTMDKVKPAQPNIPDNAVAYEISLKYKGQSLTSFFQNIEIKLYYVVAPGESASAYEVYYVSSDGKDVQKMNATYKDNGFDFWTGHLSTFAISKQVIEPVKEGGDNTMLYVAIAAILAAVLVVAIIFLWKNMGGKTIFK